VNEQALARVIIIIITIIPRGTDYGGTVVKVLCYKS
jgi:hypothetical protein